MAPLRGPAVQGSRLAGRSHQAIRSMHLTLGTQRRAIPCSSGTERLQPTTAPDSSSLQPKHQQQPRSHVVSGALPTLSPSQSTLELWTSAMQEMPAVTNTDRWDELSFMTTDVFRPPAEAPMHTVTGTASACGLRKFHTQDRYQVIPEFAPVPPVDVSHAFAALPLPASYVGIFDGHAGSDAAQQATESLHHLVAQDARLWDALETVLDGPGSQSDADMAACWKRLFCRLDQDILAASLSSGRCTGCTALAAVYCGNTLIVANAGDTRGVLCRGGQAVRLTTDHCPGLPAERQRVERHGGQVREVHASWRVALSANHGQMIKFLAVSRALGDREFKDAGVVTAEPDVTVARLRAGEDTFSVFASDGVWRWCTDQDAVDCVLAVQRECAVNSAVTREQVAEVAAKALVNLALLRGSHDDITVIVQLYC